MEELRLTLKRKERAAIITGEDGKDYQYILREMSGAQRDAYMSAVAEKTRFDSKGNPAGMKSFDGLQAMLLSLCLLDETLKLVSKDAIQSFPATTQSALFEAAQVLNGLVNPKEAGAEPKNAQGVSGSAGSA